MIVDLINPNYMNAKILISKEILESFPAELREVLDIEQAFPNQNKYTVMIDSRDRYLDMSEFLEGKNFLLYDDNDAYAVEGDIARKLKILRD